jgi:hypothetical protein
MFCKSIIKKPYMFRPLMYDHPQGLSFVLSALTIFPLLASSFAFSACGHMQCNNYIRTVFIYQDMRELKTYDGRISLTYVYVTGVSACGLSSRELSLIACGSCGHGS